MSNVFVAWLHPGEVNAAFAESLSGMVAYDFMRALGGEERQLSGCRGFHAGVNIAGPRNGVVRAFLDHSEWGDWLLTIDVDMLWPHDAVEQLLAVADAETAPIVGGLCFGATDGQLWPTLYELIEGEEGPYLARRPLAEGEVGQLLQVTATGGAFLMVHRRVLEAMQAKGFNKAWPWYQETELSGYPCGEDLTFCLRAGVLGFPVHVNTALRIGHVKPTVLGAGKYLAQQDALAQLRAQRDAAAVANG